MTKPGDFLGEVPPDLRATSAAPPVPAGGKPLRALQPPMVVPPYGASFFFASDDMTVGPGPATAIFGGANAKVTLPQGSVGAVREFNAFVNTLLITNQISFAILVNGTPAEGFAAIRMPQITLAAYGYSPNDFYVVLPAGAVVQVRATVTDAASYALSFSLRGWSWSADQALATWSSSVDI